MVLPKEQALQLLKHFVQLCCSPEELQWLIENLGGDLTLGIFDQFPLRTWQTLFETINNKANTGRKSKICNVILWILSENVDEPFVTLIETWSQLDKEVKNNRKKAIVSVLRIPVNEQDESGNFVLLEMAHRQVEKERTKIMEASLMDWESLRPAEAEGNTSVTSEVKMQKLDTGTSNSGPSGDIYAGASGFGGTSPNLHSLPAQIPEPESFAFTDESIVVITEEDLQHSLATKTSDVPIREENSQAIQEVQSTTEGTKSALDCLPKTIPIQVDHNTGKVVDDGDVVEQPLSDGYTHYKKISPHCELQDKEETTKVSPTPNQDKEETTEVPPTPNKDDKMDLDNGQNEGNENVSDSEQVKSPLESLPKTIPIQKGQDETQMLKHVDEQSPHETATTQVQGQVSDSVQVKSPLESLPKTIPIQMGQDETQMLKHVDERSPHETATTQVQGQDASKKTVTKAVVADVSKIKEGEEEGVETSSSDSNYDSAHEEFPNQDESKERSMHFMKKKLKKRGKTKRKNKYKGKEIVKKVKPNDEKSEDYDTGSGTGSNKSQSDFEDLASDVEVNITASAKSDNKQDTPDDDDETPEDERAQKEIALDASKKTVTESVVTDVSKIKDGEEERVETSSSDLAGGVKVNDSASAKSDNKQDMLDDDNEETPEDERAQKEIALDSSKIKTTLKPLQHSEHYLLHLIVKFVGYVSNESERLVYWHDDGNFYKLSQLENSETFEVVIPCSTRKYAFEYKYVVKGKHQKEKWEKFYEHYAYYYLNRKVNISSKEIENEHIFFFDVAMIEDNYNYRSIIADNFVTFLNEFQINGKENIKKLKILCWLRTLLMGWSYSNGYCKASKVSLELFPVLFKNYVKDGTFKDNPLYAILLSLIYLHLNKDNVISDTIRTVCDMLDMHKYTKSSINDLIAELEDFSQKFLRKNINLQNILLDLLKKISSYGLGYMKTMPLYWLMMNGGKSVKSKVEYQNLQSAAFLPSNVKISWEEAARKCYMNESAQNDIMDYISNDAIYETTNGHLMKPLALFLLGTNSLIHMILANQCIPEYFPIEMVLMKFENLSQNISDTDVLLKILPAIIDRIKNLNGFEGRHSNKSGTSSKVKIMLQIISRTAKSAEKNSRNISSRSVCISLRWSLTILSEILLLANDLLQNTNTKEISHIYLENRLKAISKSLFKAYIPDYYSTSNESKMIKIIQDLNRITFSQGWTKTWNEILEKEIKQIIKQFWSIDVEFFKVYVEHFFNLGWPILDSRAYEIMETSTSNPGTFSSLRKYFTGSQNKILKLMDKLFLKEFHRVATIHSYRTGEITMQMTVDLLLQSPFIYLYIMVIMENELAVENVQYKNLKQSIERLMNCIKQGKISIKVLKTIFEDDNGQVRCYEVFQTIEDRSQWEVILEDRKQQTFQCVELFSKLNFIAQLTKGIDMLHEQPFESNYPTKELGYFFDIRNNRLNEWKSIPEKYLFEIYKFKDSNQFYQIWEHYCNVIPNIDGEKVDMEFVLQNVWKPTKGEMLKIVEIIEDGTICIGEISKLFKDSSFEACSEQLRQMYRIKSNNTPQSLLDERIPQIVAVVRNDKSTEAVHFLKTFIAIVELDENSFTSLNAILDISSTKDMKLSEISLDIGKEQKILEQLEPNQIKLLNQFIAEPELIKYILSMGDFAQVQIMCDMAMISAGNDAMNVDKIKAFLKISTGFASLLFDLESISDISDLLDCCNSVYEKYQADNSILEKWQDCAKYLDWFKYIRDLHGSVESETIKLAQKLNESGRYRIRYEEKTKSTIKISVGGASETTENITFEKVCELRDKLMLIINEDHEQKRQIEGFVQLFSNVEKLMNSYINLKKAGCLLFHNWSAEIWYFPIEQSQSDVDFFQQKIHIVISFGDKLKKMKSEGYIGMLTSLNKMFVDALYSWKEFIRAIRSRYYYLNYYNINQICYLCKELATWKREADIPDQILILLSAIYPNITPREITKSMRDVKTLLSIKHSIKFEVLEDESFERDDQEELEDIDKKMEAIDTLIKHDRLTVKQAKAAVQHEGFADIDSCVFWILENQNDEELINLKATEFDEETRFSSQKSIKVPINATMLENASDLTLKGIIETLQSSSEKNTMNFLSSIKTIIYGFCNQATSISLQDFMGFQHLGELLSQIYSLGNQGKPAYDIRDMGLSQFQPNLLFCSENQMFANVLSLYSRLPDHPLPSSSEVLVCSSSTTEVDVEEFMKRAMFCKNGNVHCMVFSEKLTMKVAVFIEDLFQKLQDSTYCSEVYQLVIFCAAKQHYIAGSFEKYSTDLRILQSDTNLKTYLNKNLEVNNSNGGFSDKNQSMVQVISSFAAGVGKSLAVKRITEEQNQHLNRRNIPKFNTILRLVEKTVDVNSVVDLLYSQNQVSDHKAAHIIHIDITPAAKHNVYEMMFQLLVLGSIVDENGKVWKRTNSHMYLVEKTFTTVEVENIHDFLKLLPSTQCNHPTNGSKMDNKVFRSTEVQRPYQYLKAFHGKQDLDQFNYVQPAGTPADCLQVLLWYYPLKTPTWAQLVHFAHFMNVHLEDCEKSLFTNINLIGPDSGLNGLKHMVVSSVIRMAQDFCSPSLNISDESFTKAVKEVKEEFERHQLRRKWETDPHPYIFFNSDGNSMTFLNFVVQQNQIVDKKGNKIGMIPHKHLPDNLKRNGVDLNMDLNNLSRNDKLVILCRIVGVDLFDPDNTFELTADNVLKLLALYMRIRSGMPVILIGETGCGKTRMMEFLSKLLTGRNNTQQHMFTLKVHGGITAKDVYEKAEEVLQYCNDLNDASKPVILFFDEANTTEAIYAIKELICDNTNNGVECKNKSIKFVAACNPYKKLSDKAIANLLDSGLGYRVREEDTDDRLGNIAMRKLVYRVVALPPSIQPLAWDFGQLKAEAEKKYIDQMCKKLANELNISDAEINFISVLISKSQEFMKNRDEECHYVSMRDIERCIKIFKWFYNTLFSENFINKIEAKSREKYIKLTRCQRSLLHSLNICYYVSLFDRSPLLRVISETLKKYNINVHTKYIESEFRVCQEIVLENIRKEKNIALNEALSENIFTMCVCIENRIPMFLIGKPGSSKSLAKTLVGDNMQGSNSQSTVFQEMKQIHMVSFQCSALTDAVGIEGIFRQCVQLQAGQNLEKYTSVVVLDEIGLAEDSPKMPLKVLHPLLETGTLKNSTLSDPNTHEKVAFVGISNWALDPAKMNRGIFVTRKKPESRQLIKTAKAIFNQNDLFKPNEGIIKALTEFYNTVYKKQKVEFFGLRDYYSLIKMIYTYVSKDNERLSANDVFRALQRNFSGKSIMITEFQQCLRSFYRSHDIFQPVPVQELVRENIRSNHDRFLLFLTTQYNAVYLLDSILGFDKFEIIFGSCFPGDQNYTEIYRNINRIKACMETGMMVILLNLGNLYESLYDALNQHYVTFGGQRYVDIGLGGNRIKCRIAENFRLIVIEDQQTVYDKFPIPLINRLEKYCIDSKGLLNEEQRQITIELESWVKSFSGNDEFHTTDIFIGYHEDMLPSLVLSWNDLQTCKNKLLQAATPDAVLRGFGVHGDETQEYFHNQIHDTLLSYITSIFANDNTPITMAEVTSFSQMLNNNDRKLIETKLDMEKNSTMLLTLQQFNTEVEFIEKVKHFKQRCGRNVNRAVLIVQCQSVEKHSKLYESAKYAVHNILNKGLIADNRKIIVAFVALTSRIMGDKNKVVLPVAKNWTSVYIDQLKVSTVNLGLAACYQNSAHQILLNWHEEKNILDKLVLDCLAEAMDLIDDNHIRSLKRIKILGDAITCKSNEEFRRLLMEKLLDISSVRKNINNESYHDWALEVASSQKALNETGAYQGALWMYLKRYIAKVVAYIVSMCDANQNLDHLVNPHESNVENEIWLRIFQENIFAQLTWKEEQENANQFTPMSNNSIEFKCCFPFSCYIYLQIESKLNEVFELADNSIHDKANAIFHDMEGAADILNSFSESHGKHIANAYAKDYIRFKLGNNTNNHALLKDVLLALVVNVKGMDTNWQANDIVKLHLIFSVHAKKIKLLNQIISEFPEIVSDLQVVIVDQQNEQEFILLDKALVLLLNWLVNRTNENKELTQWEDWLTRMYTAAKLMADIQANLSSRQIGNIAELWNKLYFVYSFVSLLSPSNQKNSNSMRLVSQKARQLWTGLEKNNIQSARFHRIVVNSLQKCHTDLGMELLTKWSGTSCGVCDRILRNPVYFPSCNHYFCRDCLARDCNECPHCEQNVNINDLKECMMDNNDIKSHENFSASCTSFYLEYLFTNVFSIGKPADEDSQNLALNSIISIIDESIGGNGKLDLTFLNMNQASINIVVAKILDFYESTDNIQVIDNLLLTHRSSKIEVTLIDAMEFNNPQNKQRSANISQLIQHYVTDNNVDLNYLWTVAKLRYWLHRAVTQTKEIKSYKLSKNISPNPLFKNFINAFTEFKNAPRIHFIKLYMVKLGCHIHGTQWFKDLCKNKSLKAAIPAEITNKNKEKDTDYFTLFGDVYTDFIKKLNLANEPQDAISKIFASNIDVRLKYIQVIASIQWALSENIQQSLRKVSAGTAQNNLHYEFTVLKATIENNIIEKNCQDENTQKILKSLLIYADMILQSSENSILAEFGLILKQPQNVLKKYLPGMPLSRFFHIPSELTIASVVYRDQNHVYRCPNGHIYTIGNCGRPSVQSKCPECGSVIGGRNHVAASGNQTTTVTRESQAGYHLETNLPEMEPAAERLSQPPESIAVMHFMLHAALLLGSYNHEHHIRFALKLQGNVQEYLITKLVKNFNEIQTSLNKNMDDTIIFMHLLFSKLLCCDVNTQHKWDNIEHRESWEKQFYGDIVRPLVQNLSHDLEVANETIKQASDNCNVALYRLLNEKHNSDEMIFWQYRVCLSNDHFIRYLLDQDNVNGMVIKKIITNIDKLGQLRHLADFLNLQRHLIDRYNYQLDLNHELTFERYLNENGNNFESSIQAYIEMWNTVSPSIHDIPKAMHRLSWESSITTAMPNLRGNGRYAKLFIEYFIHIQNDFIDLCAVNEELRNIQEINVVQVLPNHLCYINKTNDLEELIKMHTIYKVVKSDTGVRHDISYNLDSIEKSAKQKFLLYKKKISIKTLPLITYPQEMEVNLVFEEIKTPQRALPKLLERDIDDLIQNASIQELCEAVNITTLVVHYIAKVKNDESKLLHDYLEKDLLLSSSRYDCIPKNCQLQDAFAVHQRLSWHRSITFAQEYKNPYEGVLEKDDQVDLTKREKVSLCKFLGSLPDVGQFQRNLNECIIKAALQGLMEADWRLTDILPDLETMCNYYDQEGTWYEGLPEELCFKHALGVFITAAQFEKHI